MSAVSVQPRPVGLHREKHVFRTANASQKSCGTPPTSCLHPSDGGLTGRRSERTEDRRPDGAAGASFLSLLEAETQFHIRTEPDLRGPQSVSRRTFSIATGSDSRLVAVEESSCLCLHCCGPAREASLLGFDSQGRQVFYFERPVRMDACCFACCLMEMKVYSPDKHLMGTVLQRWSLFTPLLQVLDSEGQSLVSIQGSCCPCRCSSSHSFQIVSSLGEELGAIWKKWPGFSEERNMDHEYFGLEVMEGLDSSTKVLLLASAFLLNHMFFEMS